MAILPEAASASVLDPAECMRLVRSRQVGRVIFGEPGRHVRPVNYLVVGDEIVMRADWAIVDCAQVVFEIDDIDTVERQGWSVIITGRSYVVDPDTLDVSIRTKLVPWAPGPKDSWTRIAIDAIAGRWVRAGREREELDARGYL